MRITHCLAFLTLAFTIAAPHSANAQMAADFSRQGGVDLGFDGDTCDGSIGGAIRYNSSTSCAEVCDGTDWTCPVPAYVDSCPAVGDTCSDGSIFAGLSPDGQAEIYTTPADAPSTLPWNNGNSTGYVDTTMVNCTDGTPGTAATCRTGEANTAILVSEDSNSGVGGIQPHQAAAYCDGLSVHGHSDWYLPAQDELRALYDNKNAGDLNGTFNETGDFPDGYYWSSSENSPSHARSQTFKESPQNSLPKNSVLAVRCIRKGE